ncbi:hypothetical protein M441DRAFT_48168 [Trichoderma asperellum CBS 433.97]|uniref:Uncharacterized protein n=1 Tax=Trichoderma asperellum (strain ATCC 204424 / CBS 433.97 / NBRC 101777) TaxID=1042311 RepID=A0A2T3Z694_TRIA4|nr:hypothetical protein M441DRAFT_48168 [Trichoderma asperellum CBS 433.97]PTB40315.1 hypothetical protein M441DRAFT_48168 [Trichoderma asperellum CBS 433.97]
MAVVNWLALAVSIFALFKSLFQESEDKKRIRELEDFNRGMVEFKKMLEEDLKRETATREREVGELRQHLLAVRRLVIPDSSGRSWTLLSGGLKSCCPPKAFKAIKLTTYMAMLARCSRRPASRGFLLSAPPWFIDVGAGSLSTDLTSRWFAGPVRRRQGDYTEIDEA